MFIKSINSRFSFTYVWICKINYSKTRFRSMLAKKSLILLCFICFELIAVAQNMGSNSFSQLQIPYGSRLAGLGGVALAIRDKDVSTVLSNPSLLDSNHHDKAVL